MFICLEEKELKLTNISLHIAITVSNLEHPTFGGTTLVDSFIKNTPLSRNTTVRTNSAESIIITEFDSSQNVKFKFTF